MGLVGKVFSSLFSLNRDSVKTRRLMLVQLHELENQETVEQFQLSGIDSSPPPNSRVYVLEMGPEYKISVGEDDGVLQTALPGETNLYSSSGGVIAAFIKLQNTGIVQVNGTGDLAVGYNTLFTLLTEIITAHNTHNHGDNPANPPTVQIAGDPSTIQKPTVHLPT